MTGRSTVREILSFHLVVALFAGILGWVGHGAVLALVPAGSLAGTSGPIAVTPTVDDLLHILVNNACFFVLVSVLPIVNFVMFVPQFLSVGSHAHAIADLPLLEQFELLYRHTALEVVALLLSIVASYRLLLAVQEYLAQEGRNRSTLVACVRRTARLYPVILALTGVGALLEGTAHVHL